MTILTIRKHQRFAVRHQVRILRAGLRPCTGLLVEVSLEGCRLSLAGSGSFSVEQQVSVQISGFGTIKGRARWAGEGFVGLRFEAALHHDELAELIETCRAAVTEPPTRRAYAS